MRVSDTGLTSESVVISVNARDPALTEQLAHGAALAIGSHVERPLLHLVAVVRRDAEGVMNRRVQIGNRDGILTDRGLDFQGDRVREGLLIGDWIFRGIGSGRGLRGGWLTETESDPWCPLTLTTV